MFIFSIFHFLQRASQSLFSFTLPARVHKFSQALDAKQMLYFISSLYADGARSMRYIFSSAHTIFTITTLLLLGLKIFVGHFLNIVSNVNHEPLLWDGSKVFPGKGVLPPAGDFAAAAGPAPLCCWRRRSSLLPTFLPGIFDPLNFCKT